VHRLAGRGRRQGWYALWRDRRVRLRGRGKQGQRPRPARHRALAARPRPRKADLPLQRPGLSADRRERPGGAGGRRMTGATIMAPGLAVGGFPPADQLPSRPEMPDPLVLLDGRKVINREQWEKDRRPELKELFQHYMYGYLPPPVPVTGKV